MLKRQVVWLLPAAAAIALLTSGCKPAEESAEPPPPAVETILVQAEALPLSTELPGRVEPVRVAEVRARVAGIVLSRHFREGAEVKAGELLFRIDPAPFKAALARAEGELAKAEAALFEADAVLRRYQPLVEINAVSRQDFDAAQAAFRSARAASQSARADVDSARLNLDYATVKSPISGRIGRALVTEGALVGQDEATPLAIVQQLDPVYVDFRQPAADALKLRTAQQAAQAAGGPGASLAIAVDGVAGERQGRLLFSDVTVDRATGQILLRGEFPNPDGMLLPGMYLRVQVGQGTDPAAILVPQRAVQRSTDGRAQVMVVAADGTVESRAVRTGAMHGARWHIAEGLAAGERVIVGGLGAAQPGARVSLADASAPAPAPGKQASTAAHD